MQQTLLAECPVAVMCLCSVAASRITSIDSVICAGRGATSNRSTHSSSNNPSEAEILMAVSNLPSPLDTPKRLAPLSGYPAPAPDRSVSRPQSGNKNAHFSQSFSNMPRPSLFSISWVIPFSRAHR
jgi:hypothetical protein